MSYQIDNHHISTTSLSPIEKSSTAFLIEGLDNLNVTDKPYYVDEWDFSTSHVVGVRSTLTIIFKSTNPKYINGIQDSLYRFYHNYKSKNSLPPSVSACQNTLYSFKTIAECLGSTEWKSLNRNQTWKSFLRQLKQKNYSGDSIRAILTSLNRLTDCGELDFYVEASALIKCAKKRGTKQKVAIPHRLYQRIVSHALEVVEKYHPYRHDISNVMEEAYEIKKRIELGERVKNTGRGSGRAEMSMTTQAINSRTRRVLKDITHDIPDFKVELVGSALCEILCSCLIVVQAFSGVRIGEAVSFNKDSYDDKPVNGKEVTVLTGETTKGTNAQPTTATWQSHFVVKEALQLAYEMMGSTRELYRQGIDGKEVLGGYTPEMISYMRKQVESAFIVPKAVRQDSNNYIFNPWNSLRNFIKNLDYKATIEDVKEFDMLNPTRVGELKVGGTYTGLSSHDFRRTFAVFFVRHGFGAASGIKFQFKHQNINMSGYYANNAELARMNDLLMDEDILADLKEAGIDLGIDIFDEIYNESEHLSGAQGEKIMEERMKKLEAGESVFMTRAEIEENIRRGNFHIMQLPNGAYCTNGSCDRVCGTSSFRAEIKRCEHELVSDKGAKMIAKQRDRLIAKFTNLNTGDPLKKSILTGLKQKIQVEELTLKTHEIPYEPFNDDIALSKAS
ncbi:hypothetical protein [Vibrio lentus]|uniref:hypothetical protein n=1 Tax=Vibrio lentus TaxID=136468 RepID=UPI000C82DAC3|nr:hypothetical protein [Vibrio lentus]MCB5450228.1 hypothetical protein [Vibrio lentus]PMM30377.1 hypothetical protein BCT58_03725 [Vibrio lentus]